MVFQDGHSVVVADHTGAISDLVVAWLRAQGLGGRRGTVDVTSYGADPTGIRDPRAAIRAAIAAAPAGGMVYFPPGTYAAPWVDPQVPGAYIEVTKPLQFVGPGATLRNLLFYCHGSYDMPKPLAAAAEEGDKAIQVTASGWSPGEYVQVLSQYNVYSPDAGDYQGGSVNPTTGTQTMCRTAEIHRVQSVAGSTVTLYDLLDWGGYRTSTSGMSTPMAGVTRAEVRRLRMLEGLTFEGMTFTFDDRVGFRGIMLRACARVRFREVTWQLPGLDGAPFRCADVHDLKFVGCSTYRRWDPGTKIDTTFYIGGGTTRVGFYRCSFTGDAQGVDVTTQSWNNIRDPGYETGAAVYSRTVQRIAFMDCDFQENEEGALTHPATMHLQVVGCTFIGGSTGFRCRSLHAYFSGNRFYTSRAGLSFSSFVDNSTVESNLFQQAPSAKTGYDSYWGGIGYNAYGNEILTQNKVRGFVIQGNVFRAVKANSWNWGLTVYCEGDETRSEFSTAVKRGMSSITVQGNTFDGCSARVGKWLHGVSFLDNAFQGGSDRPYYIDVETDAGPTVIHGNMFDDRTGHVRTAGDSITGYSYDTRHVVGTNATTASSLAYALTNTRSMTTRTGG